MGITIKMDSPHDLEQLKAALDSAIGKPTRKSRSAPKRKRRKARSTPAAPKRKKRVVRRKKETTKKKVVRRKKKTTRKRKPLGSKVVTFRKKRYTLTRGTIGFPASVKNRTLQTETMYRGTSGGKVYAVWIDKETGKVSGTQYVGARKKKTVKRRKKKTTRKRRK